LAGQGTQGAFSFAASLLVRFLWASKENEQKNKGVPFAAEIAR